MRGEEKIPYKAHALDLVVLVTCDYTNHEGSFSSFCGL